MRMAQALIQLAKECLWKYDTDPKIWDTICELESVRKSLDILPW